MKKLISFLLIQIFLLLLCSCSAENSLPAEGSVSSSEPPTESTSEPPQNPSTTEPLQSETQFSNFHPDFPPIRKTNIDLADVPLGNKAEEFNEFLKEREALGEQFCAIPAGPGSYWGFIDNHSRGVILYYHHGRDGVEPYVSVFDVFYYPEAMPTHEDFERISEGMLLTDVVQIVGFPFVIPYSAIYAKGFYAADGTIYMMECTQGGPSRVRKISIVQFDE